MSTVRTRRETITGSFFNPDAGRNSPGGSADLPQRNVLPPRCLTLRLFFFFFFFLEPLYPFQRCSIRSHPFLLLPLLSLFLSVVVPSRPFVSRPLALPSPSPPSPLSPPSFILPLFSPCYPRVSLLAFIVGGSRFSSFYFSISRRTRFSSSFPLRQYRGSADEQTE